MTFVKVKNQFEIEEIETFLDEHEGKTVDELLDYMTECILATNPEGLKTGMREAGYDVDSMEIFKGVNDDKTRND